MKNKPSEEIPLLRRALRIAAVEAYISEIVEATIEDNESGIKTPTKHTRPNRDIWVKERIDEWIDQAEILINRDK